MKRKTCFIVVLIMIIVVVVLVLSVCLRNTSKERYFNWDFDDLADNYYDCKATKQKPGEYQNWDFDDLPETCRCKIASSTAEKEFGNVPHFGGTPNISQVWL